MPTFGQGVIRRFSNDTSSMTRLAARDFEDILQVIALSIWISLLMALQCAIPVFEGLLPTPHDAIVQTLLFRFAEWHSYTKMRLHTELTLDSMSRVFTSLTQQLRKFRHRVCEHYTTVELPRERASRHRQEARNESRTTDAPSSSPKRRSFNMKTYKFHALGDYIQSIKFFGTTDSFTTQIVRY